MSAILRNKKLIIIIVLAGIVAAVAWYFLRPAGTPPGLAYGNGRLEATETAVATKVQGKLIEVYFREGADLKTGQIAAQLDDAQLKADIRAAEAAVEQAKEYAKVAREDVKSAQSQQQLASVTLRRTQELIKKGFISAAQLDKDVNTMRTANATLASARNRVIQADASIREAEARVDSLKSNLDDLTLRSPVDGRILYRLAEPGEVLSAGGRVFSILDLNDVYMYIYLSNLEAGSVELGSEARIILDAIPDNPIPCTVTYVSPRNQFTPKEVETRDEREKFMFRVKLQVNQDWLARNIDVAKSGMPGVGWVKTDPDAVWPANMQVK
ncbi:HlyD family efflux transporter periplasmic adaptor subunit [Oxalobacter sp. OxGP1]|uniref:HlyD family secretion protein n=1 Tax=Oxalobacter paeniformigenes TaxID=2946594 RepID=UPI0022AE6C04|nr:HlyD family efflux transporter periplasmic adaptor subunit [Oxalobacter paeniformigenes]MCZ4053141.1 HlyD family efflux transporter periplasmic adaptor subunit [Oxalobacter paeniformigenes]